MPSTIRLLISAVTTASAALPMAQTPTPEHGTYSPPPTRQEPVTDTYHGTSVTEQYRWLEDGNSEAVRRWNAAQNAYSRSVLDRLPHREAIGKRVTEILSADTVSYFEITHRDGRYFAMKYQPPKQQPLLVTADSLFEPTGERPLVDPGEIDPAGLTAIDWFQASPDGKLVAVSLSSSGTEVGDVHVFDVATGKEVHEVVPRANTGTAGGSLAWAPDGSGFYYTRHPRGDERPAEDMNFYQQVYYHQLGTPTEDDRYELGRDFPRIAEIQLVVDDRTGRVLATVQRGDGGEFAHYLRETAGTWQQFSRFEDKIIQAEFGPRDDLFIVSRQDAPRGKVLRVPIADLTNIESARVIVPEGEDAVVTSFWTAPTVLATESLLYVAYQLGGPSEIRVFDHQGGPQPAPRQLPISSVGGMERLEGDNILFSNGSYVEPTAAYLFEPERGQPEKAQTRKTALATLSPISFDDCEVVREFATSNDGTRVPVNIILRKGTERNGQNPSIASGYGGYGVSLTPGFNPMNRLSLDQGVVLAIANLRGGGEYGETWHLEGNLTNKQIVFDDFTAVLKPLVDRKYTNSERLAITGGSNGGLLMGAVIVQHPELVRAVVSYVGIYDMLRVELSPNGAFNVTEFGSVKDPAQFRALYEYSPYHNVEDNVDYPAVLFITGENDPRVDPLHSRKMTARMQAATSSSAPILLRTTADAGHGGSTPLDERIRQATDAYSFLFYHLGIEFDEGLEK
jgi:prolyl oligopeptidase